MLLLQRLTVCLTARCLAFFVLMSSGFASASTNVPLVVERFSVPTSDGLAAVDGVVTFPKVARNTKLTPIVIVGGTAATADNEVYTVPNEPLMREKYWLKDIGDAIASRGYFVVRFNNRGIHSLLDCESVLGRKIYMAEYAQTSVCYNGRAAGTTTFATQAADIKTLFSMLAEDQRIDLKRTIMVVHSEGTQHVASLLNDRLIAPAGIVFIGAPVESPRAITHWQEVGRQIEWVSREIGVRHGFFTNAEITQTYAKALDGNIRRYEPLLSPYGGWSKENISQLAAQLDENYDKDIKLVMSADPKAPTVATAVDVSAVTLTITSNSHYQSIMSDDRRAIDGIKKFQGRLCFFYGGRDVQIPVSAQIDLIRHTKLSAKSSEVVVLEGIDHGLFGADGHFVDWAEDRVVDKVVTLDREVAIGH